MLVLLTNMVTAQAASYIQSKNPERPVQCEMSCPLLLVGRQLCVPLLLAVVLLRPGDLGVGPPGLQTTTR